MLHQRCLADWNDNRVRWHFVGADAAMVHCAAVLVLCFARVPETKCCRLSNLAAQIHISTSLISIRQISGFATT
jgi:hypothetical protein